MSSVTKKSTWKAYLFWLFGGLFGLHHLYLGRDLHAFVFCCSLGGLGLAWIRDSWWIPTYVAEANQTKEEFAISLSERMKKRAKPPFSFWRFIGEVMFGYIFGLMFYFAIPQEPVYGYDLKPLTYLTTIAISLGVYSVGNIGNEEGDFMELFQTSVIGIVISYLIDEANSRDKVVFGSFVTSILFTVRCKKWRQHYPSKSIFRRFVTVTSSLFLFYSLLASGLYFNGVVKNSLGENIKFRDAVSDFFTGPAWDQLKTALTELYNLYSTYGWRRFYEEIRLLFDSSNELKALQVLGLPFNASKNEIVARWRTLSKEWHPDRQQDANQKQIAQEKFMEYQAAYQSLIKYRGKYKAHAEL